MNKYLLDTCVLLWAAEGQGKLSPRAQQVLTDPNVELYLSAGSVWEIAIKNAMGNLPLPVAVDEFIERSRESLGLERLPIDDEAAMRVGRLPLLHRDPFDRVLVSQALVHYMTIVTSDSQIAQYGVNVLW